MKLQDRLEKTFFDAQEIKDDVLGKTGKWIDFKEMNPEFVTFLVSIGLLITVFLFDWKAGLASLFAWFFGVASCFRGKVSL